jgi:hypothetical protein
MVPDPPFALAADREFELLGWETSGTGAAFTGVPSALRFRWIAAARAYEVLLPGLDWLRVNVLSITPSGPANGFPEGQYALSGQIFPPTGAAIPVLLRILNSHVAQLDVVRSPGRTFAAIGLATANGDVPVSGTKSYPVLGPYASGLLTIDFAAATITGTLALEDGSDFSTPATTVNYTVEQVGFASGATTFTARLRAPGAPADGSIEGRFFGPGAHNLAIRIKAYALNGIGGGWTSAPLYYVPTGPLSA